MIGYTLLSLLVGILTVFQALLNRKMGATIGLSSAIFINALVLFVLALFFLIATRLEIFPLPNLFRSKETSFIFHWSFLLPGIFGLGILLLIPFCVSEMGALRTFTGIVAMQMIITILFDHYQGIEVITAKRIVAAIFATLSVFLVK